MKRRSADLSRSMRQRVDGDTASLVHCLVDAVDYDDPTKEGSDLLRRLGKQRYHGV
jgi:hypothetical protein